MRTSRAVNVRAVNFPLMDSIRAIALLSVIGAHTAFFIAESGQEILTEVRFDFAVRVFFVISAFLLYRPFVRSRLGHYPPPALRAFAWRRLLRIVPPYWLALTVVAIWLGLHYVFTADGVPIYYGFAQIYWPDKAVGGIVQAWSLCVEVIFYALLPVIAALMRRLPSHDRRRQLAQELWMAALLFAIGTAYKVAIVQAGTLEDPGLVVLQLNTLAFLDDFALGMALATLSVWYEGARELPRPLRVLDRFPGLAWLAALAAVWVVSTQLGITGELGEPVEGAAYIERHYLFTVVALGLVLPAMFGDPRKGLVRRLLANRALLYLGMVSYAVYLYHFAVLIQLQRWDFGGFAADTTAWLWYPVALGGGVLLATASWYLVERPFLRLKRLVPSRPEPPAGQAFAEPAALVSPRPQPE
jgi:peptidoglycan/LPS O-acetylase OafA/YrhL